jgi:hypothetical protein
MSFEFTGRPALGDQKQVWEYGTEPSSADGLRDDLNQLVKEGWEIFSILSNPDPHSYYSFVIVARRLVEV